MKSDWDVIVAGAGPAGAMAAMRLADAGLDVSSEEYIFFALISRLETRIFEIGDEFSSR